MARYKHIDTSPKFIPVDLHRQLLPGTIEHALCHLIDHEIDLSHFDVRYRGEIILCGLTACRQHQLINAHRFRSAASSNDSPLSA